MDGGKGQGDRSGAAATMLAVPVTSARSVAIRATATNDCTKLWKSCLREKRQKAGCAVSAHPIGTIRRLAVCKRQRLSQPLPSPSSRHPLRSAWSSGSWQSTRWLQRPDCLLPLTCHQALRSDKGRPYSPKQKYISCSLPPIALHTASAAAFRSLGVVIIAFVAAAV
jgi:hypothetical protein